MALEMISWPVSNKEYCRTWRSNRRPSEYLAHMHQTELPERALFSGVRIFVHSRKFCYRATECRSVISWKNLIKQCEFVMGRPCGSVAELARCSADVRENLYASPGCHTLWHFMGSIRFWNIRTYVTYPFTCFIVSFACACICIFRTEFMSCDEKYYQ